MSQEKQNKNLVDQNVGAKLTICANCKKEITTFGAMLYDVICIECADKITCSSSHDNDQCSSHGCKNPATHRGYDGGQYCGMHIGIANSEYYK
jgi:hypothetical protein